MVTPVPICPADLDGEVAGWARALAGRAGERPTPLLVAIDGRSGSGKSTLCRALCRALRARGAGVRPVHLDDLYPGWDGLAAALPMVRELVVLPLMGGGAGCYTSWDWPAGRPGSVVPVPPRDVVVVEGVGARGVAPTAYDLVVWVSARAGDRERRVLARDGAAMTREWARWVAQEDDLFGPDAHPDPPFVVDAVVDTSEREEGR